MRVVFIVPDFNYVEEYAPDYSGSFHLGVGYLSSSLKAAGHETALLHIRKPISQTEFMRKLMCLSPDLVAFSSFTHQFSVVKEWAKWIKKTSGFLTLCGGVHSTIDPEDAISSPDIDMVCIGEGEAAMVELCNKMERKEEFSDIQNIWTKSNNIINKNSVRPLREDLDNIPFPDWELFNYPSLNEGKVGRISILASRGCPYNCTYCSNHRIKEMYPNPHKYVRFRSVDNVLKEIEQFIKQYPKLNHIAFIDDTVGLKLDWLKEFAIKYPKMFKFPIYLNSRVNLLNNDQVLQQFVKLGVRDISIGIESGNEKIRETVLGRKMTDQEIINAVDSCRKKGIKVGSYSMVGIPGEDLTKILDTIKLNARVPLGWRHVSIFQPYPQTRLYDLCIREGYLKKDQEISTFFKDSIINMPNMTSKDIGFAYKTFYIFVRLYIISYKLPKFISQRVEKLLDLVFCNKGGHKIILFLLPVLKGIFFPVTSIARFLKKYVPGLARFIRNIIKK